MRCATSSANAREHHQKVVNDYYAKNKKGDFNGCQAYDDFRALLDNKTVDAVLIATPDHWHAITCVSAAKAHKDIYSEKPLTLNVAEGGKVVSAAAKGEIIFQTGSQQRSEFGGRFRKAVELVRNGRIGTVKTIRIGVGGPGRRLRFAGASRSGRDGLELLARAVTVAWLQRNPLPEGGA